jgi:glutathione synthase/RimK-type ligase-like ATP-grasp enzyme
MLASGLDFGAVDVIWNERQQRAYVLEINSAPGLEGTTIDDYVRYFGRQI